MITRRHLLPTRSALSTIGATVVVGLLFHVLAYGRTDDPRLLSEGAQRSTAAMTAPVSEGLRHSDTALSPRSRPSSRNWREPFEKFSSNRILWTYDGAAIIADAKNAIQVQCAVDFWVPESHPRKEEMVCTGRHGEYGGNKSDAKQRRGILRRPDINSIAWREYQLKRVQELADAGCRSFQQDNPWLNYQLIRTGGCYANESVEGFHRYLRNRLSREQLAALGVTDIEAFNYRATNLASLKQHFADFQKESTRQYHDWLHSEARRYVEGHYPGHRITFSANLLLRQLQDGASSWLFPYFDFLVSEADGDRESMVPLLRDFARWAKQLQLTSAVTFPTNDVWLTQRAIATAYAFGLVAIAPWDVYQAPRAPRFYGDPAHYAPLFRMVRANPKVFDDFESDEALENLDGIAALSQGYVAKVRNSSSGRTAIVQGQGLQSTDLQRIDALHIGKRKYRVVNAANPEEIVLEAGTSISIGEPMTADGMASQHLISVRKNIHDSKQKAIHVVKWSDAPGRFLVLKKENFPSPPTLAITSENPLPTTVSRHTLGNYYIYTLDSSVWITLY